MHDIRLPDELGVSSVECFWSLKWLVKFETGRKEWVEACFPNPEDEYDVVWHHKLVFLEVSNGDALALDLKKLPAAPVVYLSYDDGGVHGYILDNSFTDFMEQWSLL